MDVFRLILLTKFYVCDHERVNNLSFYTFIVQHAKIVMSRQISEMSSQNSFWLDMLSCLICNLFSASEVLYNIALTEFS